MTNEIRDSIFVGGEAPDGSPLVSVVFGRRYRIDPQSGRLDAWPGFKLQTEVDSYPNIVYPGKYRPAVIRRDVDVWAWRNLTDLVIQGHARSEKPVRSLDVRLQVRGSKTNFSHEISVTGDRVVEQGRTGLRLSEAEPFTEMPLRYDKAYGGTDELAEAKYADPLELKLMASMMSREDFLSMSEWSYPRNPPGKGYLVDPEGTLGLAWPNLEFPGDRLSLETLCKPMLQWSERPYPACFDWFSHGFFPRCAFFGDYMPTEGDVVPAAEVERGILPANLNQLPLIRRPKHAFAQGAHPFLCRNRFEGDEEITVTNVSNLGKTLRVQLPKQTPRVHLRLPFGPEHHQTASLDCVFLEADELRLTLIWRATVFVERNDLLRIVNPAEQCSYRIE